MRNVRVCLGLVSVAWLFASLPTIANATRFDVQHASQTAPDNTKRNQDQSQPTADQQKMNTPDRTITQRIRKSIHQDQNLSTYAHNIKIVTQGGKVTLRGPVRSDEEKAALEDKAVAVAGKGNVTNQIEVAPAK
jgi:hyperosmotically inducible protein